MKRIIYSSVTKFVAVVLILCSVGLSVIEVINTVNKCYNEDYVYGFEESFEEADCLSSELNDVMMAVYSAYASQSDGDYDEKRLYEDLEENLEIFVGDMVFYYIVINGEEFINCEKDSFEALFSQSSVYSYFERSDEGGVKYNGGNPQGTNLMLDIDFLMESELHDEIKIYAYIDESYVENCRVIWEEQKTDWENLFDFVALAFIASLVAFIYLCFVAGKTETGRTKLIIVEGYFTEIPIMLIWLTASVLLYVLLPLWDVYESGDISLAVFRNLSLLLSLGCAAAVLMSVLSCVKKIRCGVFLEGSLIVRVVKLLWSIFRKCFVFLWKKGKSAFKVVWEVLFEKSAVTFMVILSGYTLMIMFFSFLMADEAVFFINVLATFVFAVALLSYRVRDIERLKNGAEEIKNGNTDYKIKGIAFTDLKQLACDINEVGDGVEKSVAARLKAERLKSELVTNVSHDLKTPLTSIINYTKLLSDIENLPEEARDYIKVISKKSERLKNLTADLFEVSKLQSGNETYVIDEIDAKILINQSMAEFDNEIKESGLEFSVKCEDGATFLADGRKMSRVLGNLISNALKYSLKNTRVFIEAKEKDESIVIEVKNTSAYPLDFDTEEITARFVRGDKARTDEGSGLGLAIAKGYVEEMGGGFEIAVDGDLFKAILTFDKK